MNALLKKLIVDELGRLESDVVALSDKLTELSDLKSRMNMFTMLDSKLLVKMSEELDYKVETISALSRLYAVGRHAPAVLIPTSVFGELNSFLNIVLERLPKHIQIELIGDFEQIGEMLNKAQKRGQ